MLVLSASLSMVMRLTDPAGPANLRICVALVASPDCVGGALPRSTLTCSRDLAPAAKARRAMRILFITSNRLGDAVLSTGLLDHLIRAHSDARITVACGPVAEGLFARMPHNERTIVLDKHPYRLHWLPLWSGVVTT